METVTCKEWLATVNGWQNAARILPATRNVLSWLTSATAIQIRHPQPTDRILGPGKRLKALSDLDQQIVALGVTERIVDFLEAVQIEK